MKRVIFQAPSPYFTINGALPKIGLSTHRRYLQVTENHILPALGHFELQKITPQRVQAFYAAKLKEGQSTSSVHIMHAILSKAFDTAVKWRLLSYNPCKGTSIPNKAKREAQSLTEEQARHLLETARGHNLEAFVVVALSTGMRHGELAALRWSDVDMVQGIIHVHRTVSYLHKKFYEREPKTKSSKRRILIPIEVCTVLQEHKRKQQVIREQAGTKWQNLDLIFCRQNGEFEHESSHNRRFYKLLQDANLPKIHIHDLRHSAATLMGAMGVNPKVIQEMLGHSSLNLTMNIYAHVLPSMQIEAREKMKGFFQKIPEQVHEKTQENGDQKGKKEGYTV